MTQWKRFSLTLLSWFYRAAVHTRHFLYDRKVLLPQLAPLPVVSIGNIMAGGTGKTQATLILAEELSQTLRVAILSRGYRGGSEKAKKPLVVCTKKHSAALCGDEPWLLASRLSSSLVIVNKNRFKSAVEAHHLGAQVILLDDGMQHRRLHRNVEIVVIDGQTPFGAFLPKGQRREEVGRLKNADLILFVGYPDERMKQTVNTLTSAPQITARIQAEGIFHLDGSPLESIKGREVALFCGIGNPSRFVKTVEGLGATIVAAHFSSDHTLLGEKALQKFATLAKKRGAELLVCTEKDKVKLAHSNFFMPIVWVRTRLEIEENREAWDTMISNIKLLARTGS